MKKGDLRKQEILDTAEMLFCRNGYEQMEGICRKRAGQIYSAVSASAGGEESATAGLDRLLSGMIPFRDEKLSFLMMLLPIFRLPEGRMVRTAYCEALSEQFGPDVCRFLQAGQDAGEFSCREPDIDAGVILAIVNRLWTEICVRFISAEESGEQADVSELLRLADSYRLTVERMILLPCGSLHLVDIPTLAHLAEQIHSHWTH